MDAASVGVAGGKGFGESVMLKKVEFDGIGKREVVRNPKRPLVRQEVKLCDKVDGRRLQRVGVDVGHAGGRVHGAERHEERGSEAVGHGG